MRRVLFTAAFVLLLLVGGTVAAPPAGAVAPANDDLSAALEVAFQPYTNVQTNVDATLEVGENDAYNTCQGDFPGAGSLDHTVWYKYTHTGANTTLQVDTLGPGTMDAVLRISTGPASSPTHASLLEVACGDEEWGGSWAAATFPAVSGQTYYIQVGDSLGGSSGIFALNISPIISNAGMRFTVTSDADSADATPDGVCDVGGGACTLRAAIQEANGLVGTDVITFEVGGSPVTIAPATPLPAVSGVVIDARTEDAFSGTPAVVLDGISVFGTGTAFSLQLAPVSVRGFVIGRFIGNAFLVQSNNNVIQGNYLGVAADGEADVGNTRGVYVTGGRSGTIIGGTTGAARNVISGNALGVFLDGNGAPVTNNRVLGNYIGTNASGTAAIPNDDAGVDIGGNAPGGATGNIIGDSTVGALPSGGRNVISGNAADAVFIYGSNATGNTVAGNYIGLNASGTGAVPNTGRGINMENGASSNTIGGNISWARNVISGNSLDGIRLADAGTTANAVIGNWVGTDVTGNVDLGNGGAGIAIENAPGNIVGGSSSGPPDPPGNVVSGNLHGITILGEGADGNVVQGNVVGLNAAGNAALGNADVGIWVIGGADNNMIGGTVPGARNVSSANVRGIAVFDTGTTGNTVQGNFAGTNVAGTAAVGNASEGVGIGYGASGNTVGGSAAGAGNVLSGNGQDGVRIGEIQPSNNNTVAGNYIGTNAAGTAALGNGTIGVSVLSGSTGNTIGDDNVISGNTLNGVQIDASNGNTVRGNYIGTNASATAALANGANGVLISGSSTNIVGGNVSDARNVISGNAAAGISVTGGGSNTIKGNYIGLAADGQGSLGNAGNGIAFVGNTNGNIAGGMTPADANVISANGMSGVQVTGFATLGNLLIGNLIGADASGTLDRGNTLDGVRIEGDADNTGIGNGATGGGNVISGNNQNGINITGAGSSGMEIWGNKIGTNSAGTTAIPNNLSGIQVWGAVNTSIGGNTAGKRNVISGNTQFGIAILPVIGSGATGNTVKGNYIGTQADGKSPLGNGSTGITLFFAPSNTIGGTGAGDGNTIAFNGGNGVTVDQLQASGNLIQRNSIHSNGVLGIDLVNGANGGILPPTILSFNPPANEVIGETCAFCTVEVFSDSADEGRVYQGTTTADSLGDWVVSAPFLGPNITATATTAGNTSEFSAPFACPDGDLDTVCDAGDNCATVANPSQSNADGDALGDHCDTSDTDGDGFTDETEARYVGTNAAYPCGFNSWPADLWDQPPFSANKITVQDLTAFIAPVRRLGTSPGDADFSARWDLVPGAGIFTATINIQDMTAIVTLAPPMFGGARALNGPDCPFTSQ